MGFWVMVLSAVAARLPLRAERGFGAGVDEEVVSGSAGRRFVIIAPAPSSLALRSFFWRCVLVVDYQGFSSPADEGSGAGFAWLAR